MILILSFYVLPATLILLVTLAVYWREERQRRRDNELRAVILGLEYAYECLPTARHHD